MNINFSNILIKKSVFLSTLLKVTSKEDINKILKYVKVEHKKANHICYGYVLKNNMNITYGFFDDGEPKGTASHRIRDVILHNKLENVLLIVIRYFGGIKLGAGGLSRAYTKASALAIQENKNNIILSN
ncbi:YigZ family protein [Mycoplasma sp. 1018B]|uniref:IMPACT family protein n=1 Tax=Mycoplasma sp. 1018B TaxID=2967302 RepID=UPI00211CBCBF|nr:YigZ family protein [Mycoplasma sp. 1018B]UUM19298.1 YigZ family protein [Mycoplasma sp. 1018B]